MKRIVITELEFFTRKSKKILDRAEIDEMKEYLIKQPEKGSVIQGTSGVRKMRWAAKGKGKSGGARIIYYYLVIDAHIYLMSCYSKNEKEDLDADEKKAYKRFIESLKG